MMGATVAEVNGLGGRASVTVTAVKCLSMGVQDS